MTDASRPVIGVLLEGDDPGAIERARTLGWNLAPFRDPCLAFAELLMLERTQAARSAWGLSGAEAPILLLAAEPPAAMIAALGRHRPEIEVWRDAPAGPIRVGGTTSTAAPAANPTAAPPRPPRDAPRAATTGAEDAAGPEGDDEEEGHRITPEELAMLFEDPSP